MKARILPAFAAGFAATMVATTANAQTGALAACQRAVKMQAEMAHCLLAAHRTASDDMLAAFQKLMAEAERLDKVTGRGGASAAAATQLPVSQRDFERYVDGQCRLVHALYASGNGADQAALACEIDLLRERAAALRALAASR